MSIVTTKKSSLDLFNPTEDHLALRESVASFAEREMDEQAKENDEKETFNTMLFKRLGSELGIFGITVPEADGGHGLDPLASVIIHEEMSRFDPGFTLSYLAHEVLFVNNFFYSSNSSQRSRYLSKVITGEWIGGMGMTEPGAGTDVLGMTTHAVKKGDRYIINGVKQYITNGSIGQVFVLYTKLEKNGKKMTSFVIESSYKGFSVGKKEEKMGMRSSPTTQLVFEDMEVPEENLLGVENGAVTHMMRNLEIERVTLAAQSLGIARRCIDIMCDYTIRHREAFGKKLMEFGQIQRMVAESYADYQAARALVYQVASELGPDVRNSLGAASAKLVATQMAERVSRNAIQVLGGYGYCREYPVERLHRDAILLSIGGGTNEAMQKNIASDLKKLWSE
ncbi:isovaleryl-CoA dehydrogenase [Leptospira congkakensis]|uniref:Isovaleryl-CoA dehydrogenase n=1 Tax=Leptospira congkakensis TaxID=2484932 RepID=A0A4Z0ZZ12_9LEPT|nr:acyl-CoA dehydrogenase family protein [Leptospira congkakensis]TGL86002.1 isovaleryl-CoA dehydrogenase [Leptospira congkakensis]TGL88875.1 isovaleryl-CoA dehydrogenase [Leptospira congkakensis]TGL93379.1 isovaleryl-CoA dehydrogenase [Leptospira congkakensis]